MNRYDAPVREMRFVLHDVLAIEAQLKDCAGTAPQRELVDAVLDEAARFTGEVLAPLNAVGDAEGCVLDKGDASVRTPTGFRAAYARFIEGGWSGLTAPEAWGGQHLPEIVGAAVKEMIDSANLAWGTYPLLSHGATEALKHHGEEWQREAFLRPIVDGSWTGTMCLTEPHAGSDLGMLRARAVPAADDTFDIHGTKIFITAGENDFTDNIVHLVLARLPDAPAGVKGISLFIVPKFRVARDGTVGARNAVQCGALEHKMGLRGSSTCVMNFDGANGYLIGAPHQGLKAMFT
ncbi:MAG: acyl-CoA dehydrogenase family protein, partial [Lysobacterales bacterium]